MSLEHALAADRAEQLQSAADEYENVLLSGQTSLHVLLNLAVLYWQATDPGLAAAKRLSPDFLERAGRRVAQLLADARRLHPQSTEVRFWQRYIAWADLGEPFGSGECRDLLREDPATLIPAMHLFALSEGSEANDEAHQLLRRSRDDGTTRARYVASVIEGVTTRISRRR